VQLKSYSFTGSGEVVAIHGPKPRHGRQLQKVRLRMKMEIDESPTPSHSDLFSTPGTLDFSQSTRLPEKLIGEGGFGEAIDFSSVRQGRQFSHQYAHTYFIRLSTIRPILEQRIRKEWPDIPLKNIAGLCESSSSTATHSSSPKKLHNSPKKYSASSPRKGTATSSSLADEEHGQHIALREDVTVGTKVHSLILYFLYNKS